MVALSDGACAFVTDSDRKVGLVRIESGTRYTCTGTCEVCTELDPITGCNWQVEAAYQTDDATGEHMPKEVCTEGGVAAAEPLCIEEFQWNLQDAFAYDITKIRRCVIVTGPTASGNCDPEEYGTDEAESHAASGGGTLGAVRLDGTILKLDATTSRLQVGRGGTSASTAASGWIQIDEDPFRARAIQVNGTSVTLGTETFDSPRLAATRPIYGTSGTGGAFVLDLSHTPMIGSATRNGALDVARFGVATALEGSLNFQNSTFTSEFRIEDGGNYLDLILSGTIFNRPPKASFTLGGVVNCVVTANGSGSSDPAPAAGIAEYFWRVGGMPAGTGVTKNLTVHQGLNTVDLAVRDNRHGFGRHRAVKILNVTANPPCP